MKATPVIGALLGVLLGRAAGAAETITYISVTIDTSETVTVSGTDSATGKSVNNYKESIREVMEHEIGGHASEALKGTVPNLPDAEAKGWAAENAFRAKNGNTFQRTNGNIGLLNRRMRW